MVFSKAFLATTEKKLYADLTFNIENKYIYIFIAIIIYIFVFCCCFFHAPVLFFTSSIAHAQHELSWMMGKMCRSM